MAPSPPKSAYVIYGWYLRWVLLPDSKSISSIASIEAMGAFPLKKSWKWKKYSWNDNLNIETKDKFEKPLAVAFLLWVILGC